MVLSDSDEVSTPSPVTDDDATPPPVATVTPAPATVQPVSPPSPGPGGNLQPVGLLPLALGGQDLLDRFAIKVRWRVSAASVSLSSGRTSTLVCFHVFAA